MNVSLPQAGAANKKDQAFFKQVIERLKLCPESGRERDHRSAACRGENSNGFYIEGTPAPTSISLLSLSDTRTIDFDYFNV